MDLWFRWLGSEGYGSQGVDGEVGVLNVDFGGSYGRTHPVGGNNGQTLKQLVKHLILVDLG
ncbi:hypothetical protein BSPWISOXPB_9517 [uncultured Gammaproteobacteria bacterium]|nr:hypothetical protein BSPWISOXPB_9517 [uncultured Gammaproteobacteria bacterium]